MLNSDTTLYTLFGFMFLRIVYKKFKNLYSRTLERLINNFKLGNLCSRSIKLKYVWLIPNSLLN